MAIQKYCPSCSDQTNGRTTPHTVKNGNYKCGLCGHETPRRTRVSKKARDMEDLIKRLGEAKDSREYGYEGEMVMSQLKGIMNHAEQLHDMLEPSTDLPEWVQSKITLAYDYIQTAADYMATEMSEAVDMAKKNQAKAMKAGVKLKMDPDTGTPDHFTAAARRKKGLPEEVATNSVGAGNVAGLQGEPPVNKKKKNVMSFNRFMKK